MMCVHSRLGRERVHSTQVLADAVEELHQKLGDVPFAPVGQALFRDFSASYLGIDLDHLIDDYATDPAEGEGVDDEE
jgi:hypothetical protein